MPAPAFRARSGAPARAVGSAEERNQQRKAERVCTAEEAQQCERQQDQCRVLPAAERRPRQTARVRLPTARSGSRSR